jgi:hypothetical protein
MFFYIGPVIVILLILISRTLVSINDKLRQIRNELLKSSNSEKHDTQN